MKLKRRIVTAGSTFLLALGTGHLMQNPDALQALFGNGADAAPPPVAEKAAAPEPPPARESRLDGGAAALRQAAVSGLPDLPALQPAAFAVPRAAWPPADLPAPAVPAAMAEPAPAPLGQGCAQPRLALSAAPSAMIDAVLDAPCHPGTRVVLRHAGLGFALVLSETGRTQARIPAFEAEALVSVEFALGEATSAAVPVPDLVRYRRIGLQIQDGASWHLSALESGAAPGSPGHVTPAAPRDPATTAGGYMTLLGDAAAAPPLLAEVYTLPAALSDVEIEIEAEVTAATCGTELVGRTVRMQGDRAPVEAALALAMPPCDAIGDLVILPLPPLPLTLAARE